MSNKTAITGHFPDNFNGSVSITINPFKNSLRLIDTNEAITLRSHGNTYSFDCVLLTQRLSHTIVINSSLVSEITSYEFGFAQLLTYQLISIKCVVWQWRIKDFQDWGRQLPRGVREFIILQNVGQNCVNMKEFGPRAGRP